METATTATSTSFLLEDLQKPDESTIMRRLNFTDDMYNFILNEPGQNISTPCMESFYSIGLSYKSVHGYISLTVCTFGTIANILNMVILTQKEMRTPINRMLTALAFVDILVMIEYVPFALHMYILDSSEKNHYSKDWATFVLFHSHFTQILHTISIQLTLTMAIWRFVVIKFSTQAQVYCTFKRCYIAIATSYILPVFICIPNYLTFAIYHRHRFYFENPLGKLLNKEADHANTLLRFCVFLYSEGGLEECMGAIREKDKWYVDLSDMAKANNGILHSIHFWTFSVVVKLLPCFVLTFFMVYLIKSLYETKMRHQKLLHATSTMNKPEEVMQKLPKPLMKSVEGEIRDINVENGVKISSLEDNCKSVDHGDDGNFRKNKDKTQEEQQQQSTSLPRLPVVQNKQSTRQKGPKRSDRTSRMLIAVLLLFLITEFPQGIMAFLSGIYGQEFFRTCYNSFAEVWDILALINSSINFILYCFMSKQFRTQFQLVFHLNTIKAFQTKWSAVPTVNSTVV